MMTFGVLVGSLAAGGVESLASVPQIVVNLGGGGSSGSSGGGGSSGGSGTDSRGGQGGQQTITETVPAPSTGPGAAAASTNPGLAASGGGSGTGTGSSGAGGFNGLPPIKHVFLVVLSQQGFNQSFGPGASDTYLAKTLEHQGELVQNYYAVAGSPLANEIALISGQGPTQQTETGCPQYSAIDSTGPGSDDQVIGDGCVYPSSTQTLANQLTAKHDTWKAYVQGMPSPCDHPQLGAATPQPTTGNSYSVTANPFVFFSSITGSSRCRKDVIGFGQLKPDLAKASKTPTLSYIVPDPCDNGSDQACAPGATAGLAPAMIFLESVTPEIKRSPAYKSDGLIAITFDQAPQTGPYADSSSCCNNPTYPNLPTQPGGLTTGTTTTTTGNTNTTGATTVPTTPTTTPTTPTTTSTSTTPTSDGEISPTGGGGQVGLLLISPYVKPNSLDTIDYFNHFALLGGIENLLGLGRLGYAGMPNLPVWTSSVFNAQK